MVVTIKFADWVDSFPFPTLLEQFRRGDDDVTVAAAVVVAAASGFCIGAEDAG
jgi:hypothetical protein